MTVLTRSQIRDYASQAGFTGSALDTITAIFAAENGSGDSSNINNTAFPTLAGYHAPGPNDQPEYSVGNGQINALAHFSSSGMDFEHYVAYLLDPLNNAKEAFKISGGGTDFTPWSTFNNGSATGTAQPDITLVDNPIPNPFKKRGDIFGIPVPFPTGPDIIGNPVNPTIDAAKASANAATVIAHAVGWLFDTTHLWRLLLVGTGATIVLVGVYVYVGGPEKTATMGERAALVA
jgi:hypothetical protein